MSEETTSSQPQLTPEQLQAIRTGVVKEIFGDKFEGDVEKAKVGYWNQTQYNSQLVAAQAALEARVNPGAIADQRGTTNPWDAVKTDYYGDTERLREAVRLEAGAIVEAAFAPIQQSMAARQRINATLPDYVSNEQKVNEFLMANPEIHRLVYDVQQSGNPEAAMRLAWGEFVRSQPATSIPDKGNPIPGGSATPPTMQATQPTVNLNTLAAQVKAGDMHSVYGALFANLEPNLPPHMRG